MGLFSKPIKTLDDLLLHHVQDIYYAEKQIVKNLPTMISKATNANLKQALETHLQETQGQVERLEHVFRALGETPKGVDCAAIDGILKEATEVMGDVDDKEVLDAAIIASAQAVEHYEITRYGTMVAFAERLGKAEAARLLQQTLDEEKATDKKLTVLAESKINRLAA